jgi:cytochrome P450
MPRAVDELLRLAGPSRAVFRRAHSVTVIGGERIAAGDGVILMLSAANRDPERFASADRIDLERETTGHVAFGRGAHSCSGSALIRMAMAVATRALLDRAPHVDVAGDVEWLDGFAIRGPSSLPLQFGLWVLG